MRMVAPLSVVFSQFGNSVKTNYYYYRGRDPLVFVVVPYESDRIPNSDFQRHGGLFK